MATSVEELYQKALDLDEREGGSSSATDRKS